MGLGQYREKISQHATLKALSDLKIWPSIPLENAQGPAEKRRFQKSIGVIGEEMLQRDGLFAKIAA